MRIQIWIAILALVLVVVWGTAPFGVTPSADGGQSCSTRAVAGRWLFATDVGHQSLGPGGDITAIGTLNIDSQGNISGTFDVTVQDAAFRPGNTYEGTIVVNSDCTGTMMFQTSTGSIRTDSIAVVSRGEFWGMSQDTRNLWTYRARRVQSHNE
jgi:hypothetical protein